VRADTLHAATFTAAAAQSAAHQVRVVSKAGAELAGGS
jgi:hypothetical protein